MHAAPAVQVSVTRFGVWRAAVGGVLAIVWLVVVGWLVSHGRAVGRVPPAVMWAVATGALVSASWLAARLVALRPFDLRWDGRSWHVATGASADPTATAVDAEPGDLRPAIDLGDWLLLRFVPERTTPRRATPRWLALQRRGLEPSWHALRCAVHSPRPMASVTTDRTAAE